MPGPYAPPGETADDLWFEKSNFVGAVLGGVAYGVHAAVFIACFTSILGSTHSSAKQRARGNWLLAFITLLFALATINVACNTRFTQLQFIDNRNFPGGPNAWLFAFYSIGVNTAGNASYVIANAFTDGLLLWRTYVVWNTLWVIAFPFLVFLGSTAMGILTLFQASRPDASLWTHTTIQFSLPYFSISIALNTLLTLLLVGRLLYMSRKASRSLGQQHAATYISVASMLVESAAPYTITSLIFIITYARNSYVQNLVLPVLSQIMCISPEFIILRVATGRAVTSKPYSSSLPSLQAAPGHTPHRLEKFSGSGMTTMSMEMSKVSGSMTFAASSKSEIYSKDV